MKTRRIKLVYESDNLQLEATVYRRPTLTVRGHTAKGGRYEVVVPCGDVDLAFLARCIRDQFKRQRANELRHADWREEPLKP